MNYTVSCQNHVHFPRIVLYIYKKKMKYFPDLDPVCTNKKLISTVFTVDLE